MKTETIIMMCIGFITSLVLLAPDILDFLQIQFSNGVLTFFSFGAHYMGIFFHELGHTFFSWSYGYPAIPTFDAHHGGGMAYTFSRQLIILVAFYALCAYGIYYYRGYINYQIAVALFMVIHVSAAFFEPAHNTIIAYMGHGTELLVGGFFIYRALFNCSPRGAFERALNSILGFFLIFNNAIFSIRLVSDLDFIHTYERQKGGYGLGDFSKIADVSDYITLQYIAIFTLIMCALALIIPTVIYIVALATGRHYEIK